MRLTGLAAGAPRFPTRYPQRLWRRGSGFTIIILVSAPLVAYRERISCRFGVDVSETRVGGYILPDVHVQCTISKTNTV